ncbi:MAG: hypothetical protein D6711_04150 [Chloroflexi bacterium]|nr:MAG: hypothetical protein D6711_04150 [Chloroflexota bacterium]
MDLIERYNLNLPLPKQPNIMDHTIIIQRRELANWLRLQTYGFAWAATQIDQYIPDLIPPQPLNFNETTDWEGFTVDSPFEAADLSLDLFNRLELGIPLLIVNEPMFISDDPQHYNIFYPRWAYDHYRQLLSAQGWTNYIDLSNSIPPQFFTDSPVHLNPQGITMLRDILMSELLQRLD